MSLQPGEPIAIVGSACRFAGSTNSPSKLWDLLRQPRDLRREVPATRFSVRGFYHPDGNYHGHSNVSHAYLLDDDDDNDPSRFDSEFFGIKPVEARAMDPQQRILLEVVYEALESAGLPIERLRGSDTAVYVGSMTDDYTALLLRDLQDTPTYTATGTARSMLSNRISHVFDWRGPSVSLDTACSASLVAVHLAVQTLRAGESRTAVACGANLILGPENFIIESKLNMLSPDGRSKMWDQGANGYARGEGVAAVVLKTLRAALEDGDHVECIIRETGLNQDGATPGITMPSAAAQQALIQKTYSKAGLDLAQRSDHPQYFEAHGTGTPAGDPVEAEAIYNALGSLPLNPGEQPLYVGSVKTVLGHTEGTAGVAAILKASLALQHGCIPPNLWFESLSTRVAPFYKNVEIPLASRPWPQVAAGGKRRASVNSFGFGGANVHAILENYGTAPRGSLPTGDSLLFTPFVFSASSQQSLTATLRAHLEFLDQYNNNNENREDLDPHDLLWTLQQRRSVLGWRMAITAPTLEELPVKLRACLTDGAASIGVRALPASSNRILGIFTGQGAQYARMGAELIQHSETARGIILRLDSYLRELPDGDRPAWSLESELMADESSSRVHEASISQPLCTAVQILLVDLLRLGGVRFSAVVGHSSGEIAAAYSAGFLTARDAICIAYYRGFHLQKASSPHGHHIKGAMLAVGTSAEDATELCMDRVFKGRIVVAAINSPSSVTIAGDEDAIAELETILEDEKIFFRRLRVDRAYHSPHMLPCADPYVESLRSCGVTMQTPKSDDATWFSTVYEGMTGGQASSFGAEYWAENMTKPVLFSQGVSSAIAAQSCDLVVEVGPHPALKGPTSQTIQRVLGKELPYHGTLSRGASAVEAMSSLLGLLWMYLDPSCVNLNGYERAMNGVNLDRRPPRLVKGLPTYRWDHGVRHWHESRRSRKMRQRVHRVHPLLGDVSPDSTSQCMSWNHFLSVSEMEWLDGHRVQGGAVFPAAGYVCTALEAARFVAESVCPGKKICLVELGNFTIHQAVTFDGVAKRVEVLVSMHDIERPQPHRISATFNYSAALGSQQDDQELTLAASCRVHIVVGDTASFSLLPTRKPDPPNMLDVETERFYAALADLGYGFSGRFRSLSSMYRKHGRSTCQLEMAPREEGYENLLIHPAELDAMLQSIMLARSHPYDEELRKMHLPTAIRQIRVNPSLLLDGAANLKQVGIKRAAIDSVVQEPEVEARGITGHANLYSRASAHAAIQIQGATFMPLGGIGPEDDRKVFSKVHWVRSKPDGEEAAQQISLDKQHYETVKVLERIAVFYLRKFSREFSLESESLAKTTSEDHALYLKFAQYVASVAESGGNPWIEKSWLEDTLDDVMEASKPFSHIPDVHMMHLVGAEMPKVFAGETTMLEQFRTDGENILDKYYTGGFGVRDSAAWVGRTVKQIADRYAHMNILEIGE
jgi:acyl transferase domain-containing protein